MVHYSLQLLLVERLLNAAGENISTKYQGVDLKYIKEKSSKTTNVKKKKKKKKKKASKLHARC